MEKGTFMIDLHTHTLLSDGELIPSEMARRAEHIGYRCLGLADHVDSSNLEVIVPSLVRTAQALNPLLSLTVVPAAELTHVPPALIAELAARARELGASVRGGPTAKARWNPWHRAPTMRPLWPVWISWPIPV